MRLPRAFIRLPVRFDAARLAAEIAALPSSCWARHPADYSGNSSLRLISHEGRPTDAVGGPMLPTPELQACPYLRQVLASFGVVWSRSRLMRLAPGALVPEHADINLHWFRRVRVHIPVLTHADVRFHCGGESVHMAAGEAWLFDNWRLHSVDNTSDVERIHLVADTYGSASFWSFALSQPAADRYFGFDAGRESSIVTERMPSPVVLPPGEIDLLVQDFVGELAAADDVDAHDAILSLGQLLHGFALNWRQMWTVFGEAPAGHAQYRQLRDTLRLSARDAARGLVMRTNQVPAQTVLEARVLHHALSSDAEELVESRQAGRGSAPRPHARLDRPLILLAAPRSGSTWLYEMLVTSPQLWNLGGEAHWLFESLPALRPGAPGVDSNRLDAQAMTPQRIIEIRARLVSQLRDTSGRPWSGQSMLRLVEKTPKNVLRVPALERLFPDALYVLLWRNPRENLASILEAWDSGRFVTYPQLEAWDGPWSLLLPPGWQVLRGASRERIAAHQWESANRIALDDLEGLSSERWMCLDYAELRADPARALQRICTFAGLDFDPVLAERAMKVEVLSRYTLTPPDPDKWRRHESSIERELPVLTDIWNRLQSPKR